MASFILLALAVLLAVGGTLFLVLRALHADATTASLGDVAGSVLPQVRQSIGGGNVRGTIEEIRDSLAERGIEIMVVGADGGVQPLGGAAAGGTIPLGSAAPGESVHGTVKLGDQSWLYVATVLRRTVAVAPRAVAFLAPDRSAALALADLGRAIPAVALILLIVGVPLAWLVARSVTRPLRRLADAAGEIPAGRATVLPLEGPEEVRELTETFNGMAGELATTRRRESDLFANLRHDLRTPLTVISGFATALRDGTAEGHAAIAAARAIEEEAARLERLVEELGSVERIRSGEDGLRPESIEVPELLAATASRFGAQAIAAGVTLTAQMDGDARSIVADPLAVDRMLGNLVSNALAALPAGGHVRLEAATVSILSRSGGIPAVALTVIDDGPGFPDGAASRAFDRFWRGDPARAGGGSGLGLAIVRELAVAHGGTAFAENLQPRGARVGVILPALP
ncbi:MAG TPA: HAMP domain-containing sensor histidine kinase [Candidatus Eisenbacteria bacterium]|nr:HAMP domain-containing sensor histidine kinase [Candidatus Eisenbacteria bacterium]